MGGLWPMISDLLDKFNNNQKQRGGVWGAMCHCATGLGGQVALPGTFPAGLSHWHMGAGKPRPWRAQLRAVRQKPKVHFSSPSAALYSAHSLPSAPSKPHCKLGKCKQARANV